MDSNDITTAQARQIHESLFKLTNYLVPLKTCMEKQGFPLDDPLCEKARKAHDAVNSLRIEVHYMSCETGMGRPPRK